jgi:membrane protease YdiL (CAAX protease family)
VGAASLLTLVPSGKAEEERPSEKVPPGSGLTPEAERDDRAPPGGRARFDRRGRWEVYKEEPRFKAVDLAAIALSVSGLAGLFALLSKRWRSWLLPPPRMALRTGWGAIELAQGLMFILAFLILTGQVVRVFASDAVSASHFVVLGMNFSLGLAVVALTTSHVARGGTDGIRSRLKAALPALGLSLEGAGTNVLRGLAGGSAALPVAWALAYFAGLACAALGVEVRPHPVIEQAGATSGLFGLVVIFVSGTIVVPLGEELAFRGFVFGSLRDRYGLCFGVLASSLFFAVVHGSVPNVAATFALGVIFCGLYERSGTLLAPVVAHSYFNLCMLSLKLLQRSGQ